MSQEFRTIVLWKKKEMETNIKYGQLILGIIVSVLLLSLIIIPFIEIPYGNEKKSYSFFHFMSEVIMLGKIKPIELFSLITVTITLVILLAILILDFRHNKPIKPFFGLNLAIITVATFFWYAYLVETNGSFAVGDLMQSIDSDFQASNVKLVTYSAGYDLTLILLIIAISYFLSPLITELLLISRAKDKKIVDDFETKIRQRKVIFYKNRKNIKK